MAQILSPGVYTKEFDLTGIVPAVSTTEGGVAGQFVWGPVNSVTLIDSEKDLLDTFGRPNNTVANDWFSAANFLAYGNKLWVVRVVDETSNTSVKASNATSANSLGFLLRNDIEYANKYNTGQLKASFGTGDFIARYPGAIGNSLKISVCPSATAYSSSITGTVSVTANSSTVTGSGTNFTTSVQVGDFITIGSEERKVVTVANTTSLTVASAFVSAASAASAVRKWEYYSSFDSAPTTSVYAASLGGSNDEMHIAIVDEDGLFTQTRNTVLETFPFVSKGSNAKGVDGSVNYYKEVLNVKSEYVRWGGEVNSVPNIGSVVNGTAYGAISLPIKYSFVGGRDGNTIGSAEKIRGFNYFADSENTDAEISVLITSDANQTVATHIISNIVEKRQDCVAFFSPPKSFVVDNIGNEVTSLTTYRNTLPSTSYAALDSAWKYQYDKYNDVYRYLPANGDVAGLHVKTDEERDAWWAAAGLNRGQVKNTIRLSWNPKLAERDLLYKININPLVTFPGEGTVLFGQKTLLTKPSAFDRLNVRRLFIVMRKAVAKASKYFLFEFNDEVTRTQFKNMVEPYLRDIQGRRGITAFRVVIDTTNNTPEVIDRNEMVCDIYVQPARVAEVIRLNFVATRTGEGVFEEVVGKIGTL